MRNILTTSFTIYLLLCNSALFAQSDTLQWKKLRALDFLAGSWSVESNSRLSLNGEWDKSAGKSTIKVTLDSNFFEEEYSGYHQGKEFRSKTFFAVNNTDYKYQRVFIDAPHGVLLEFEGQQNGDSLIFDRVHTYANGKKVKLRAIYLKVAEDHFTVETMRMPEESSTWDVNSRMTYTRIKAP